MRPFISLICVALGVSLLGGCSSGDESELNAWMQQQRATTRPKVTPIEEPKQFKPADYFAPQSEDPFASLRLTQALRRDTAGSTNNTTLLTLQQNRRKEPLEAYPLDTIRMVGSMNKTGVPIGLVRVDKLLYQVRVGDHLGMNYGRVTAITESKMQLTEIVQDPTGDWIERPTTLDLQEGQR